MSDTAGAVTAEVECDDLRDAWIGCQVGNQRLPAPGTVRSAMNEYEVHSHVSSSSSAIAPCVPPRFSTNQVRIAFR